MLRQLTLEHSKCGSKSESEENVRINLAMIIFRIHQKFEKRNKKDLHRGKGQQLVHEHSHQSKEAEIVETCKDNNEETSFLYKQANRYHSA